MSERMQEALLSAAQLAAMLIAGVLLYQMEQPEVGSLVIGAALGHAAPRRARRGGGGGAAVVLLGAAAIGGGMLAGCGASEATRASYSIEAARCIDAEHRILEREDTTLEQDQADLAAERERCDAALRAIEEGR